MAKQLGMDPMLLQSEERTDQHVDIGFAVTWNADKGEPELIEIETLAHPSNEMAVYMLWFVLGGVLMNTEGEQGEGSKE